jgi:hypothetical protein
VLILKKLWIEMSGERYPEEFLDLDWDNDDYCCKVHCVLENYRNLESVNLM